MFVRQSTDPKGGDEKYIKSAQKRDDCRNRPRLRSSIFHVVHQTIADNKYLLFEGKKEKNIA